MQFCEQRRCSNLRYPSVVSKKTATPLVVVAVLLFLFFLNCEPSSCLPPSDPSLETPPQALYPASPPNVAKDDIDSDASSNSNNYALRRDDSTTTTTTIATTVGVSSTSPTPDPDTTSDNIRNEQITTTLTEITPTTTPPSPHPTPPLSPSPAPPVNLKSQPNEEAAEEDVIQEPALFGLIKAILDFCVKIKKPPIKGAIVPGYVILG